MIPTETIDRTMRSCSTHWAPIRENAISERSSMGPPSVVEPGVGIGELQVGDDAAGRRAEHVDAVVVEQVEDVSRHGDPVVEAVAERHIGDDARGQLAVAVEL